MYAAHPEFAGIPTANFFTEVLRIVPGLSPLEFHKSDEANFTVKRSSLGVNKVLLRGKEGTNGNNWLSPKLLMPYCRCIIVTRYWHEEMTFDDNFLDVYINA